MCRVAAASAVGADDVDALGEVGEALRVRVTAMPSPTTAMR
jgi:hypothetical protein